MEESGLLPTNEHATAFTIQSVGAGNVELVATVHWFSIRIIADKPAQGRNPLGCRLHIHHSFDDTAHIVSIANDSVELEGMLPRVTSDCSGIRVPRILGQILQAHPSSTQECQAGTPTSMAGDLACSILLIDASSRAERRNQGFVDETRSDTQVLIAEEIVNLLALL